MTLKWTLGQGSGVGSEFEVLVRWLNPDSSAAAGETDTSVLVKCPAAMAPDSDLMTNPCGSVFR